MKINEAIDVIEKSYEYEGNLLQTEAWQTLKTAVLAQQSTNTAMLKLLCNVVTIDDKWPGYSVISNIIREIAEKARRLGATSA